MARRHIIGEEEIKKMPVSMLVDTGSVYMAINETIREQLQLPVEVRFKNRRCTTSAMVLPADSEPLLGAIPLEDMDVLFHPQRQELIVNPEHPYFVQMKMK